MHVENFWAPSCFAAEYVIQSVPNYIPFLLHFYTVNIKNIDKQKNGCRFISVMNRPEATPEKKLSETLWRRKREPVVFRVMLSSRIINLYRVEVRKNKEKTLACVILWIRVLGWGKDDLYDYSSRNKYTVCRWDYPRKSLRFPSGTIHSSRTYCKYRTPSWSWAPGWIKHVQGQADGIQWSWSWMILRRLKAVHTVDPTRGD